MYKVTKLQYVLQVICDSTLVSVLHE